MAIDSRDKRMSMITLCSPVPQVLPNPDAATFSTADRAMLAWLYHGITLASSVAAIVDLTLKARAVTFTLKSRAVTLTLEDR